MSAVDGQPALSSLALSCTCVLFDNTFNHLAQEIWLLCHWSWKFGNFWQYRCATSRKVHLHWSLLRRILRTQLQVFPPVNMAFPLWKRPVEQQSLGINPTTLNMSDIVHFYSIDLLEPRFLRTFSQQVPCHFSLYFSDKMIARVVDLPMKSVWLLSFLYNITLILLSWG